jgi:predicted phage terminase large subunit-like protein
MMASYEADYARSWGRKTRDVMEEWGPKVFGVQVAREPRAADWWTIKGREGVMVTAGVGGPITGKGAHLLIIDDPVKNAEDAASRVFQEKQFDWWRSTASTRLMPGAVVVLVMTRWNEDDLAGKLLVEQDGEWTLLNLPAVAEDNDALGRKPGEFLCEELYDAEEMRRTERRVGSYFWNAMYQQRPAPPEGSHFKLANLRYWREESRAGMRLFALDGDDGRRVFDQSVTPRFQTVDVALSEKKTADWTVVATWAATGDGDLLLLDLERQHFEEQQLAAFLEAQSDKHGRPPMWIERFGAGRSPLRILSRDGYPVREIPVEAGTQSDKITRAFGAVALTERHQLFLPASRPDWVGGYELELATFPYAKNDDMVDVTSYAARLLPNVVVAARPAPPTPFVRARPITAGIHSEQF